jgi:hypothetical protein
LRHTHQHAELAATLRAVLEARLLRPGAHTAQVRTFRARWPRGGGREGETRTEREKDRARERERA